MNDQRYIYGGYCEKGVQNLSNWVYFLFAHTQQIKIKIHRDFPSVSVADIGGGGGGLEFNLAKANQNLFFFELNTIKNRLLEIKILEVIMKHI